MRKISRLQQSCDREFSKLTREKGRCEKCGSVNYLEPAHIVGRKNLLLRWDVFNVLCLCRSCHSWGHLNPKKFNSWVQRTFPGRWEYIQVVRNQISKRRPDEYEELLKNIRNRRIRKLVVSCFDNIFLLFPFVVSCVY